MTEKEKVLKYCAHVHEFPSIPRLKSLYVRFYKNLFRELQIIDPQLSNSHCSQCKTSSSREDVSSQSFLCIHCNIDSSELTFLCKKHTDSHEEEQHIFFLKPEESSVLCVLCDSVAFSFPEPALSSKDSALKWYDDRPLLKSRNPYENRKGGRIGLFNIGNSCFANSILQGFFHAPPLIKVFTQSEFLTSALPIRSASEISECRRDIVYSFAELMTKTWERSLKPSYALDAEECLRYFGYLFRNFNGYTQQDAQEFLMFFLDTLSVGLSSWTPAKTCETTDTSDEKKVVAKALRCRSVISDLFEGKIASNITCLRCGAVSSVIDPSYSLSLEIPTIQQLERVVSERGIAVSNSMSDSVESNGLLHSVWNGVFGEHVANENIRLSLLTCLHSFCTSEDLTEMDQYFCEKCDKKVDATKRLALRELPEILCVHIKRFAKSYNNSKWRFPNFNLFGQGEKSESSASLWPFQWDKSKKLNDFIEFPMDSFDLNEFMDSEGRENDKNTVYDLISVVKHTGSISSGHYVNYSRHHLSNEWLEFDDDTVRRVSRQEVFTQQAYILFYVKRRGDSWRTHHRRIKTCLDYDIVKNPGDPGFSLLSKYWLDQCRNELLTKGPSPIDNGPLCCTHSLSVRKFDESGNEYVSLEMLRDMREVSGDVFPVSAQQCEMLRSEFGEFHVAIPYIEYVESERSCMDCVKTRAKIEKSKLVALEKIGNAKHDSHDVFYVISANWLAKWKKYLKSGGETPRPSAVDNWDLYEEDRKRLRSDLESGTDYHTVYPSMWAEIVRIYGGGPVITMEYQ